MRYQKVVKTDGVEAARYDYIYSDGTLILITYTANGTATTARFIYDSFGEPRGFILNNSALYLYLKNAQGDITGVVDENGEIILTYTYDAWGNVNFSGTSMSNMALALTLSNVNPFTYRGYCYDFDIEMYYLQSRYYDPQICRFINADSTDYLGATGTLLSYNLFAYCENDAVDFVDDTGTSKRSDLANLLKHYKAKKIKKTFGELLFKNGKGYYTAFHELAQILIANKLTEQGYSVTLEKPCVNNNSKEIDVYASKRTRSGANQFIWEVKPLGTSATSQIKEYKMLNPGVKAGFDLGTIKKKICDDLYIKITFNGNGGAFYAFYNQKNQRITNKQLQDAIKCGVYKAAAIGIAAITVVIVAAVIVAFISGGTAAAPVAKITAVSAKAVSSGTMASIIPIAAKSLQEVLKAA